ncbi:hypothetical protein [Lentibacillus salicampi]|uniref:Uncharacterized protein n=1 Tax=Lentibacillus salicampi TaxID=175306 RepID=A0A4Y9A7G8_9BACI|nr:hypothetical protein [Lentibacillus salicampi]TFJ91699.1 hypothetical protein E4U82_16360 [Lentibacillus salicampi]
MEWVVLGSVWLIGVIVYFGGPAYLKEKGKNLATREDIGAITEKVESIRLQTNEELELLRTDLIDESEALVRKRDVYERLSGAMRIFIQGQFPDQETGQKRQQDFLDSYAAAWLWASDDLIRSLNTFILMNMRVPAENNPHQQKLKNAYFNVLLQMRKDAGFYDTELGLDDLVFVQF